MCSNGLPKRFGAGLKILKRPRRACQLFGARTILKLVLALAQEKLKEKNGANDARGGE